MRTTSLSSKGLERPGCPAARVRPGPCQHRSGRVETAKKVMSLIDKLEDDDVQRVSSNPGSPLKSRKPSSICAA